MGGGILYFLKKHPLTPSITLQNNPFPPLVPLPHRRGRHPPRAGERRNRPVRHHVFCYSSALKGDGGSVLPSLTTGNRCGRTTHTIVWVAPSVEASKHPHPPPHRGTADSRLIVAVISYLYSCGPPAGETAATGGEAVSAVIYSELLIVLLPSSASPTHQLLPVIP